MDPVTAFQVAASVITFVEFGRVLVSSAYELYKSPTGQTAQVVELSTVAKDLESVRHQIDEALTDSPLADADHDIAKLCLRCQKVGATLQFIVNSLTARGKTKLDFARSSFVIAAKGLWKAGEITKLNEELDTIRSHIMFRMILSIWCV